MNDIERCARAICDADDGALLAAGVGPIPWEQLTDEDRAGYLRYAQVAHDHFAAATQDRERLRRRLDQLEATARVAESAMADVMRQIATARAAVGAQSDA